ncbi:preprotein translocase subunit SecE [Aestuariispira insulae]|uniref:Protein translocase subunit SecE n=1 Tax=Aestuariispira insulae TaxID=1461337 RepID=A0A3D9HWA1_9PROT|nr:preprotein translocase subunit SecE [Aestuariispira insulae]RED53747.1 protein translocase subunit secE/sec61 gamma [Aestuariispira insulae]
MAKTSPAKFVREVRQEAKKVTWPTRKETGVATLMVFVMVTFMSLFFLFVDWVISSGVQLIIG